MISNRIARNIIRYVFHYLTGASRFKLDYRQVRRSHSYISYTRTRAYGEGSGGGGSSPTEMPYGRNDECCRSLREGPRGGNDGGAPYSRGFPRVPYNTVASRIRNLLLIIMLSILTRHSYFSPLLFPLSAAPDSVTWSDDACRCPNENRGRGASIYGIRSLQSRHARPAGRTLRLAFWAIFW